MTSPLKVTSVYHTYSLLITVQPVKLSSLSFNTEGWDDLLDCTRTQSRELLLPI